jgi:hypothetical protein
VNETQANKCTEVRLHAAIIEDGCQRAIIVCADMLDVT